MSEVAHSSFHILYGVIGVLHPKCASCFGHQLHQADGAFGGDGVRIAPRFCLDDSQNEFGLQPIPLSDRFHQRCPALHLGGNGRFERPTWWKGARCREAHRRHAFRKLGGLALWKPTLYRVKARLNLLNPL